MSESLTNIERETIFINNQAEATAVLSVSDPVLMRKLDELSQEEEQVKVIVRRDDFGEYVVPKKWVDVRRPRHVNMTDEQKAAAAERLKDARAKKKKTEMNGNKVLTNEVQGDGAMVDDVQEEIA